MTKLTGQEREVGRKVWEALQTGDVGFSGAITVCEDILEHLRNEEYEYWNDILDLDDEEEG